MVDVVLCADDYGYNPGVDTAIRALASSGRLSATSALVTFPAWDQAAAHVRTLADHVDVGLHVNLVEGAPLGPMPSTAPGGRLPRLGDLIRDSLAGQLARDEIEAEIVRQVRRFMDTTGRAPDFVDGHRHAHALPGVGAAMLSALDRCFPGRKLPVRDPSDRFRRILMRRAATGKALLISALTHGFARLARRRGYALNDGFSGVYGFEPDADLDALMAAFVSHAGPAHLVMCHPGLPDPFPDPIAPAREREYRYFAGPAFGERLARGSLRLVRFTEASLRSPDRP